jgi:MFS superfamily sulfate permease-like transporter
LQEGVNEKYKSRLKIPIPAELILVVIATMVAHFAQLGPRYGMALIGPISTGLPAPSIPPLSASSVNYIVDGLVLAVIGFAISISMAKMMAERHRFVSVRFTVAGAPCLALFCVVVLCMFHELTPE